MDEEIPQNLKENHDQSSGIWVFLWETFRVVLTSLAIIIPIRYYLIQPFFVNGTSMVPNFHDKDYIMVDKLSYYFSPPKRGDVIVFRFPEDPKEYYIKRIIGLPGEVVQIKNNSVSVFNDDDPQGLVLKEDYIPESQKTLDNMRLRLDNDEYFVMGDNRMYSSDSRRWGPLNKSFIAGRALIRLWPFSDILVIPRINYLMPAPAK